MTEAWKIRESRSRRGVRAGIVGVLAALFLLQAGCFFDPREAEEPGGNGHVSKPAQTPEEVRDYLISAYDTFDQAQYEELLAPDDFRFVPDNSDVTDLADDLGLTPFDEPFGILDEETVFDRLVNCFHNNQTRYGGITLLYQGDPISIDSSLSGYSRYESDYRISVFWVDFETTLIDSLAFDGSLRLFIRQEEDGAYRIYRWEDLRKGALDTWGFFKGQAASSQDFCPE